MAWDAENRLLGITYPDATINAFTYNGLGQRVAKTDSAGTTNNALLDDAIDSQLLSDGAASYVWGTAGLAGERRGGVNLYHHTDALGATRAITSQAGVQTDARETDGFGADRSKVASVQSQIKAVLSLKER